MMHYIEAVASEQLCSELETLDKLGIQLVKEFYLETVSNIFQEDTADDKRNKHANDTIKDDGSVSTIAKIGDWFARIIVKIVNYFARSKSKKLVKKIRSLPALEQNRVFEALFVDENWYNENVEDHINRIHNKHIPTLIRTKNDDDVTTAMKTRHVFGIGGSTGEFHVKVRREVMRDREELQDAWKEISRFDTSINENEGPLKHRKMIFKNDQDDIQGYKNQGHRDGMTDEMIEGENRKRGHARNIESFLDHIENCNVILEKDLKDLKESIPLVKKTAKELMDADMNQREQIKRAQESYVHFVTDLSRSIMYITQIQVKILGWLRWTLGQDHNPKTKDQVM